MLRPEPMRRALIVGPRKLLESSIEALHDLKLVHIEDFTREDEAFKLGKPLPRAAEISGALVRIRAISSALRLGEIQGVEEMEIPPDAFQKILLLESEISHVEDARKAAEKVLSDLGQRIDVLGPFAVLGLPLELYRGYRTVDVVVGRTENDLEGLDQITPNFEVFSAEGVAAVFAEKTKVQELRDFLTRRAFSPLEVPSGEGDPRALLERLRNEREKAKQELEELNLSLEQLRESYGAFILKADENFSVEIEKAEAPLRFATTEHTFVVSGWIPARGSEITAAKLEAIGPIYVELGEPDEHEEPPVLLANPRPIQPFETLINLYSTPSYRELDPTPLISLFLPFFFGFMIGDAGFGAILVILGAIAMRKLKPGDAFRDVMYIALVGGVVAMIFGLFIFGEAFGVAFHPPSMAGEAHHVTWEDFGLSVPLHPIIEKTAAESVTTLLLLSVVFAWVHLSIGYIVGIVNEVHHSRRHALAKAGWFMVLTGLFMTVLARVSGNPVAIFLWTYLFPIPHSGPFAVGPLSTLLGFEFPAVALALLLIGTGLAGLESYIAPIEVGGVLANMMSYARLAGFAIGEGVIDASVTTLILDAFVLHHDILSAVAGMGLLFAAFLMIFPLGALGAGIQALRLNYVEQFQKFFKGNGVPFKPFGIRKQAEV